MARAIQTLQFIVEKTVATLIRHSYRLRITANTGNVAPWW